MPRSYLGIGENRVELHDAFAEFIARMVIGVVQSAPLRYPSLTRFLPYWNWVVENLTGTGCMLLFDGEHEGEVFTMEHREISQFEMSLQICLSELGSFPEEFDRDYVASRLGECFMGACPFSRERVASMIEDILLQVRKVGAR